MAKKSNQKLTNFYIKNYIYLTFEDFEKNCKFGNFKKNIKALEDYQKKLEKEFQNVTGYSSENFIKQFHLNNQVFYEISKFLNYKDIKTFYEGTKGELPQVIQDFLKDTKKIQMVTSLGKISAYSNTLNLLTARNKKVYEGVSKELASPDFNDLGLYDAFLKNLSGDSDSAAAAVIIEQILKDYKKLNIVSDQNYFADFNFSFTNLKIFEKWEDLKKIINSADKKPEDIKAIERGLYNIRQTINQHIKGSNLGEMCTALISKEIFQDEILQLTAEGIEETFKHTGRENQETVYLETFFSRRTAQNPKTTVQPLGYSGFFKDNYAKALSEKIKMSYKNNKPDLKVKIKNPDTKKPVTIPITVKELSPSAKTVTFSSNIPLGIAIKWAGVESENLFLKTRAQAFYNIMNFILSGSNFRLEKNTNNREVKALRGHSKYTYMGLTKDGLDKSLLSNLALAILVGQFRQDTALLLSINGAIIPAPLYIKYVIEFLKENLSAIGDIIQYGSDAQKKQYRDMIVKAATGKKVTRSDKKDSESEEDFLNRQSENSLLVLATKRNIAATRQILTQKIRVQAYFMSPDNYIKYMSSE